MSNFKTTKTDKEITIKTTLDNGKSYKLVFNKQAQDLCWMSSLSDEYMSGLLFLLNNVNPKQ